MISFALVIETLGKSTREKERERRERGVHHLQFTGESKNPDRLCRAALSLAHLLRSILPKTTIGSAALPALKSGARSVADPCVKLPSP